MFNILNCFNCNSVIVLKDKKDTKISLDDLVSNCNTGDIVLFSSNTILGEIIKEATDSIYTHVGIILKNPKFVNDSRKEGNEGNETKLYLYNSDGPFTKDVEKEETKSGVQVLDLVDKLVNFKGKMFYRKLVYDENKIQFINNKLNGIHSSHYHTYYDYMPNNWIGTYLSINHYSKLSKIFSSPRRLDKMFCSAFTAYIYTELGILKQDTEWSFIIPSYFADINQLENNYVLEDLLEIRN